MGSTGWHEAVLTYPNQGLVSLWKSDTAGFLDFGLLGFLLGFLPDGLRLLWYLGGPEMVCFHKKRLYNLYQNK